MANNTNSETPATATPASSAPLDLITQRGLGLWVHQTRLALGKLHAIQALDFDYLVVKIADGRNPYQPTSLIDLRSGAASIGMPLVAWAFVYPALVDAQVKTIVAACREGKYRDLVLDMEDAWEAPGSANAARELLGDIKAALPNVRLHLSTFYALSKHPLFPFATCMTLCDSFMPQAYRKGLGKTAAEVWSETVDEYERLHWHSITVVPTVDTPDVLETIAANNHKGANSGARAASVWLWDGDGSNIGDSDLGVAGQEKLWIPAIQAFRASLTS